MKKISRLGNGTGKRSDHRKAKKRPYHEAVSFAVISYPLLFFQAFFVIALKETLNVGFLIKRLSLDQIVRDYTECTVFLQGTSADPQNIGQFFIREETFAAKCGLGDTFHGLSQSLHIFQTLKKAVDTRVFPVHKIIVHGMFF